MTKSKKYYTKHKLLKARQPTNLKMIVTTYTFGENKTQWVTKRRKKAVKYYRMENPKLLKTRKQNSEYMKDLSCNSKNIVYIIECDKYKRIYIRSTHVLNTRISLYKSNIRIKENRKSNVSKHSSKFSQSKFKIISIYQTNDYRLLQIKEIKYWINLNKRWIKHDL